MNPSVLRQEYHWLKRIRPTTGTANVPKPHLPYHKKNISYRLNCPTTGIPHALWFYSLTTRPFPTTHLPYNRNIHDSTSSALTTGEPNVTWTHLSYDKITTGQTYLPSDRNIQCNEISSALRQKNTSLRYICPTTAIPRVIWCYNLTTGLSRLRFFGPTTATSTIQLHLPYDKKARHELIRSTPRKLPARAHLPCDRNRQCQRIHLPYDRKTAAQGASALRQEYVMWYDFQPTDKTMSD